MNELDSRIQGALEAATDLSGPIPEPTLTDEILETFQGRHRWLMILSLIKTGLLGLLLCFCVYQFFQKETIMAMIAYASMTVICIVGYTCLILFLWIQMNHNTIVREIKRMELQLLMLIKHFKEKE